MNAYATAYDLLFRARNVTRVIAKIGCWLTGLPYSIIAGWSWGLGRPPMIGFDNPMFSKFALFLAAFFILPRLFDFALRRIVAAAQRRAAANAK